MTFHIIILVRKQNLSLQRGMCTKKNPLPSNNHKFTAPHSVDFVRFHYLATSSLILVMVRKAQAQLLLIVLPT